MSWDFSSIVIEASLEPLPLRLEKPSAESEIWVEIGFGNGDFLIHMARSHPKNVLVGMEVSLCCLEKAARKIQAENLPHVFLLYGDARFLLRRCFSGGSLDRIVMNFPCPWPKRRHAQRRVTNPAFCETLCWVLKEEGRFELTTDEAWYAEEVRRALASRSELIVIGPERNPRRDFQTKYERKWRAQGKDIFQVVAVRNALNTRISSDKEGEEPLHRELLNIRPTWDVVEKMKGMEGKTDRYCWVLGEAFTNREGVFILKALSVDEGFEQHFYLILAPTERGSLVKIDSVSHPFRTPGVKAVLNAVADFILSQQPVVAERD